MDEGSGTVAHDISGNGNDATFCSSGSTPVWTSSGISLNEAAGATQSCLDTPLTTWRSLFVSACSYAGAYPNTWLNPSANWMSAGNLWGATTETDGLGFAGSPYGATFFGVMPTFVYFPGGLNTITQSVQINGGCHVYAATLGSTADNTLDRFYVDGVETEYGQWGVEQPNSQWQNADLAPTAGHYQIGCIDSCEPKNLAPWFEGEIDYQVVGSQYYSADEVTQETNYIQRLVTPRGGGTFPSGEFTGNSIVGVGDSLTAGDFGTIPGWYALLKTNESYNVTSLGLAAMWSQDMVAMWPERENSYFSPLATKQYCHIWAGTNDFFAGNRTPAEVWQSLTALGQECLAAGGIPILATMISSVGHDAVRDQLNVLIYAGWQQAGFVALDDLAAIPQLGADGAYQNTLYFQADGTHLTGPNGVCDTSTGYGIVCANLSAVINQLDTAVKPREPIALPLGRLPAGGGARSASSSRPGPQLDVSRTASRTSPPDAGR